MPKNPVMDEAQSLIDKKRPCDLSVINTDKNPAYGQAIRELKQKGSFSGNTKHHPIK